MGAVSGQGTTYNLPNYHGELFMISPEETPFLSAIGGLHGPYRTKSTEFEWQTEDLRTTSAGNTALEGANAPTASERSRSNVTNVVEIHHSKVDVSYTKEAATSAMGGANIGIDDNPVSREGAHQLALELSAMAVDIEKLFISGTYAKPTDNTTARKTRGLYTAITTNVTAVGGVLTKAAIDGLLQTMFDNGAKLPQASTVI